MSKTKNLRKVEVYKNSDGFITEDKALAKKRQELLNKLEELPEDKWLERQLIYSEIRLLKLSEAEREAIQYRMGMHPSQCPDCRGSGEGDYVCHASGGYGPESCDTCNGTGNNPDYKEKE